MSGADPQTRNSFDGVLPVHEHLWNDRDKGGSVKAAGAAWREALTGSPGPAKLTSKREHTMKETESTRAHRNDRANLWLWNLPTLIGQLDAGNFIRFRYPIDRRTDVPEDALYIRLLRPGCEISHFIGVGNFGL